MKCKARMVLSLHSPIGLSRFPFLICILMFPCLHHTHSLYIKLVLIVHRAHTLCANEGIKWYFSAKEYPLFLSLRFDTTKNWGKLIKKCKWRVQGVASARDLWELGIFSSTLFYRIFQIYSYWKLSTTYT